MKRVILGSVMFFAGLFSVLILLAETMSKDWIVNGHLSSFRIMSQYGLIPAFYIFVGIAVLGIGIAILGVPEKKEWKNTVLQKDITNKLQPDRACFLSFLSIERISK